MPTYKVKDLPREESRWCSDPGHSPPMMMVYDPGVYEHVCPRCGQRSRFTVFRDATL